MQWGHDIPCWKPIGKPNINFVTDFYFLPKIQNLLGVQNAGNEGAAKILDFELFFFFANICAQSFYSTSSMKGKGSVYSRASWTFELLYNRCGTWHFIVF